MVDENKAWEIQQAAFRRQAERLHAAYSWLCRVHPSIKEQVHILLIMAQCLDAVVKLLDAGQSVEIHISLSTDDKDIFEGGGE